MRPAKKEGRNSNWGRSYGGKLVILVNLDYPPRVKRASYHLQGGGLLGQPFYLPLTEAGGGTIKTTKT